MRERKLIAAVALGAVALVALLMLGPGRARPIVAARLWGGPLAEETGRASFRLVLVEQAKGFEKAVGGREIALLATAANGPRGFWEGRTGHDGSADVVVSWDGPARGPVTIRVSDAAGETLAEGELPERPESWGPGRPISGELQGRTTGELAIRAAALRGVFAPPFREEIVVEVREGATAVPNARLEVSAREALLDRGEASEALKALTLTTDEQGQARLGVTPLSHDVELAIEASDRGSSGRFEGRLPILPGAMWLEPAPLDMETRRIVSPVVRELAYLSIATAEKRLFGATVPLRSDGRGHASGDFDLGTALPAIQAEPSVYLTLASSPSFEGAGTVGWPLSPALDPFAGVSHPIADVLLLDAMPERVLLERERRARLAWLSGLALLVAALVEGLLLYRAARAGLAIEPDDDEAAALGLSSGAGGLRLLVALVLTALAFSAVGIIAILQSGG